MTDCIFCKIVTGDIPSHKVYEDADTLAFLDINPINPGHTLIIPKVHYVSMLETPEAVIHQLMDLTKKIAPGILKSVGADAMNFSTNNGRAAGQLVFHTHFHLMPRFPADGYELWKPKDDGHQDLAGVAQKIREALA